MTDPAPRPDRDEILRQLDEMERELDAAELPPSDWKEKVEALLERSRKRLAESPIGRGEL